MLARRIIGIIGWCLLFPFAALLRWQVNEDQLARQKGLPVVVPTVMVARLLFLGQRLLAADVYWLRSLQYFGDSRYRENKFSQLEPLLNLATELDPKYCVIYRTAGLILTSSERFDVAGANEFLSRGIMQCTDDWYIPFVLGFNLYYFQGNYAEAGRLLALASQRTEAPGWLSDLSMRLMAQGGSLEDAEQMLLVMQQSAIDDDVLEQLNGRIRRLRSERLLRRIDQAMMEYQQQFGQEPTLHDLMMKHFVPRDLRDPSGGAIYIKNGRAMTTIYSDRLELKIKAPKINERGIVIEESPSSSATMETK